MHTLTEHSLRGWKFSSEQNMKFYPHGVYVQMGETDNKKTSEVKMSIFKMSSGHEYCEEK